MGASTFYKIIEMTDINEAYETFCNDESMPDYVRYKNQPGNFTVTNVPHMSVAQIENHTPFRISHNDDKFGPWNAMPVGETTVTFQEAEDALESHPKNIFFSYARLPENLKTGVVDTTQQLTVKYQIEVHTPVGASTGWVFYGWVN